MTQKEYKEKISELEYEIKKLLEELDLERSKSYNYEQVLEDYHRTSEELKQEKQYNIMNCDKITEQQKIIERYERILDKFTFSYGG